jgi:hypothetical protein
VTNSPAVYNGSGQAAAVSSSAAGTVVDILTGGASTQTNVGVYAVTADFVPTDTTNYNSLTGASAGNFVINKATPTISVTNSPVRYTGNPYSAAVSGSVAGVASNILTGGSSTQTDIGTYAVTADFTPTDTANYNSITGASAGNFVISAKLIKLVLPPDPKPIVRPTPPKPPEPDSTSSNIANAANPNLVVNVQEYSWDEIYKKSRYVKGKYKTVVIVFEGKVIVSPYNDKGVDNSKGTFLTGGEKINTSGEIKNNKA